MLRDQFDAVIFDLDGTLIDSMWVWKQIDKDFLGKYGKEVDPKMDKELEGKSFTETAIYFKQYFGLPLAIEEIKECWNKMAWDYYITAVPLKAGAREFLEWLKSQDIKMGIATSNSIELVKAVLKALKVESFFDEIKTSCEVGRGKPFPDIYLKVAKELKVQQERCLVFEDIPNGARAGKSAGMTVWAIEDGQTELTRSELVQVADDFVKDYHEAINKLKAK